MQTLSFQTVDMVILKYTQLPGGLSSWQNPDHFKPIPYDLVEIKTDEGIKSGWWTGNTWTGLRLQKGNKIISWKKSRELDFI